MDDIGNYGQVIRLGGQLSAGLISLGTDNSAAFAAHDRSAFGTIGSADDFALHAIALTTNEVFDLYEGSVGELLKKPYVLTGDVNLTGTGIQGLLRDNAEQQIIGSEGNTGLVFDGGGHQLTLRTGEVYGLRGEAAAAGVGSGQCYRHGVYGLMARGNSVQVKNLTLDEQMDIGADVAVNAGLVFGRVRGGYEGHGAVNEIENVTVTAESAIRMDGDAANSAYAGGLIGVCADGKQTAITVKDCTVGAALRYSGTSDNVVLGGVMGRAEYQTNLKLLMDNVTVSGAISSGTVNNARVGGLVAEIVPAEAGAAELTLRGVKIAAEIDDKATQSSGGLLGYYWNNVDVTFDGAAEYAVRTEGAKLTANGAAAGGLCYAATGRWSLQGNAVDLGDAQIGNGSGALGLLVCHGERQGAAAGKYADVSANALYLVMDTDWETGYRNGNVAISGAPGVFDEVVAYTARGDGSSWDILRSDAGIISLHTTGGKVNMTSGERNTYVNRTAYGQTRQTNPNSRYYYNLDVIGRTAPAGDIDTPEELMLWSVRKYCAQNIRGYLPDVAGGVITGALDMDGYSYYPVDVANGDVTVRDAKITFHNAQIEALEAGNKSTLDKSGRTQHFTMHSGLIHDYYTDENASRPAVLTVENLTLLGTVGMVGGSSGALVCGRIYGYNGTNPVKVEIDTLLVDEGEKHLAVANFDADYAPLLIDRVDSFAVLSIAGVKAEPASAGATSLIGRVGSDAATQGISLSLSRMVLPDVAGRFTKATMLHSLCYVMQNNSAVYNFTKEEDWNGGVHTHQVTYGREIGGTVEYQNDASNPGQLRYAQSTEFVSYSGNFTAAEDSFAGYLPYVAVPYNEEKHQHEIQVNSSLANIAGGCGTYGDPYRISEAMELQSVATYLATGRASKGWTLNIGGEALCHEGGVTHEEYRFDGSQWVSTADAAHTLTNDTVSAYLRNAYYEITQSITVNNFTGLGSRANPFRGVVVGAENVTVTLGGTLPQGFIVCSYGSVVRNLSLAVTGTTDVKYTEIQDNAGYTSDAYFGGVMGCVLGGDNIIDGVRVAYLTQDKTVVTLTGTTDQYLVPVGGYVGVISGGGVIFRGENVLIGKPCNEVEDEHYFYANPYVGRVIQGFAVQESGARLDNTEKNYQICRLDVSKTAGIVVDGSSITLSDAQALLVFSSVTNSGGAGGGRLLPYCTAARAHWENGAFGAEAPGGKVRNASYANVGKVTSADDADYAKSLKDDFAAVGADNASYLDTKYAGGKLFAVCSVENTNAYSIALTNAEYDMTGYGNGYRSISARYLANAVCAYKAGGGYEAVTTTYKLLNPLIGGVEGNGARIRTNITAKEYVDDDHHAIAVGGVFNTLRMSASCVIQNVTIGGADEENGGVISHEYYQYKGGVWSDATHTNWDGKAGFDNLKYEQGRGLIGIGGLAGNNAAVNYQCNVTFTRVNTQNLYVKGPFDAGGIIGHTGMRLTSTESGYYTGSKNYHICYLTDENNYKYIIPTFNDCSYEKLRIDGGLLVGGYTGFVAYNQYAPIGGGSNDNKVTITFDAAAYGKLGKDSQISCRRPKTDSGIDDAQRVNNGGKLTCLPAVGGLIGCSSMQVVVDNQQRATLENVEIRSSRSAGGVVAWTFSHVTIRNFAVIGKETNGRLTQIGDMSDYNFDVAAESINRVCEFTGGLIGYHDASSKNVIMDGCEVSNLLIAASWRSTSYPGYAGGLAANLKSGTHLITNCKVQNLKLAVGQYNDNNARLQRSYMGGLVARNQNANSMLYGSNLLVDSVACYAKKGWNDYAGALMGGVVESDPSSNIIYLAGVSVQNTWNLTDVVQSDIMSKPPKCYVAYGDYTGTAQDAEKDGKVVGGAVEPYVVTSPRGVEIPVRNEKGVQEKLYLYGDGADAGIVKKIYEERNGSDGARFYYALAKDCVFDARYSSDFWTEMNLSEESAGGIPNFPVLQVPVMEKAQVSQEILSYLNLVTNSGYSTAMDTAVGASSHISTSIDLYRWNEAGYFEKNPKGADKAFSGKGNDFETSFTLYDSGKNQFELLTVTFTESVTINSVKYSYQYSVQVPLVVRRMLEVDFTATLKDSPSFRVSEYEVYKEDGFKPNITVGYGTSVSALLTYVYNSSFGEAQTYGWQSYLDNGGFMGDPGQTIQFYNPNSKLKSLPIGAQLVLLDCADNNRAYRYEVGVQSEAQGSSIALSAFTGAGGSYPARWLSEIMAVRAAQSDAGKWVLLEGSAGATARVRAESGYQYFRPYDAEKDKNVAAEKRYALTADEAQRTERFYLVVYIPMESVEGIPETSETEGKNLNGYISTTLPGLSDKIACNINAVRVKQDGVVAADPHSSSESTYNFLSGYVQKLTDESEDKEQKLDTDAEAYILLAETGEDGNYLLHMDLVDEITVVKGQKDTQDTPLYFKESVSLANYAKTETDAVRLVTANGFPTGCFGTAAFYVYTMDDAKVKTYYKWNNGWMEAGGEEAALRYDWVATGGNMELYLGTANSSEDAVSLAVIRQLAKSGNEKFYVETKMDVHLSVPAAEQVIAGAITKGNAFTKLSYTTYLASSQDGFATTNYISSMQGQVRYYQARSGSSTVTHSANDPTQLGINCSDLASANGVIYTTGVYDLTLVSNAENLLRDADSVVYTLTLWQRKDSGEYEQVTENLERYIDSVRMKDHVISGAGGSYVWVDGKSGEAFSSSDPENGKRFLLPIRVQVNTDVETNGVTFANYQLRLTAELRGGGEVLDLPVNAEYQKEGKTEYIRYDYVTYTITRILTSGYWGP